MLKFKKYWWLWLIILVVILLVIWPVAKNFNKVAYNEITNGLHLKGSPEASVSIVEFSDFQCPACGAAFNLVQNITETYGDKIRFEYRNFPLTSIHRYAYKAAEAAECAADQGKFWEYHDLLFTNQESLTDSDLLNYASQIDGLDVPLWNNCLAFGVKEKRVDEDIAEANDQGYNATPTFILNGQKVLDWGRLQDMVKSLVEPLA